MKTKWIVMLIACVLICLSVCGCSNQNETGETKTNLNTGTTDTFSDNENSNLEETVQIHHSSSTPLMLEFSSVKEMVDTITENDAYSEYRDEFCNIVDVENPLDIELPMFVTTRCVSWLKNYYMFILDSDMFALGTLSCYTKDQYEKVFQKRYENFFLEDEKITFSNTLDDRNATEILYANSIGYFKVIRYQISDGSRTLYIQEHYTLYHTVPDALLYPMSDSTPGRVEIFSEGPNEYLYVCILGPLDRPSVYFLDSFGLAPLQDQ